MCRKAATFRGLGASDRDTPVQPEFYFARGGQSFDKLHYLIDEDMPLRNHVPRLATEHNNGGMVLLVQ